MRGAGRAAYALSVVLLFVLGPATATAAPSAAEREARHRFDEGETLYRAGHYAEALDKYQAGYAADPLPGFLINIAQCQRRLGDLKTARATYREFVVVAPDSRLVPEVEELIKELDDLMADLGAGGSDDKAADVDESADVHATDPSTSPIALAAAPPAAETSLLATPATAPTDAPAPEPPPKRSHAGWWIWGGVAVAAIAGGVVTAMALSSPTTTTVRTGSLGTLSK